MGLHRTEDIVPAEGEVGQGERGEGAPPRQPRHLGVAIRPRRAVHRHAPMLDIDDPHLDDADAGGGGAGEFEVAVVAERCIRDLDQQQP